MGRPAYLEGYSPTGEIEERDLARLLRLHDTVPSPYDRALPLHVTGSAVVLDPTSRRVLLRWHERQGAWLQVGGHGDPGEVDPVSVAVREAREETGLDDLALFPAAAVRPLHVVIVRVRRRGAEAAHEHADVRYLLATASPGLARPEHPGAPLRWMPIGEAAQSTEPNLAETLSRVSEVLGSVRGPTASA